SATISRAMWLRVGVIVVAGLLLGGCDAHAGDAYRELQDVMKQHYTKVDHQPVDSVACLPHVVDLPREAHAAETCLVRMKDGRTYTVSATIQNENFGGAHNLPNHYFFDPLPQPSSSSADYTKVLPPRPVSPADEMAADDPRSLYRSDNLRTVMKALEDRFGR